MLALDRRLRLAGRHQSLDIAVPLDANRIAIVVSRLSWGNASRETIRIGCDLSLDGGATWRTGHCGFTAAGGDLPDPDGPLGIADISSVELPLGGLGRANRMVRLTADLMLDLSTDVDVVFGSQPVQPPEQPRSPAFDAASSSNWRNTTGVTFSHTCSGTNRLLTVGLGFRNTEAVNTITYNAVGLSRPTGVSKTDSGTVAADLWYLIAPATGANNVVISMDASNRGGAGAVSYTDVHQTTTFGTPASATGSGTAPTVNVSSATGELVIDVVASQWGFGNQVYTPGAGQGSGRWADGNPQTDSANHSGAGSDEAGAATVTMSWGLSQSTPWSSIGIPVKPLAGASVTPFYSGLSLMGVGSG